MALHAVFVEIESHEILLIVKKNELFIELTGRVLYTLIDYLKRSVLSYIHCERSDADAVHKSRNFRNDLCVYEDNADVAHNASFDLFLSVKFVVGYVCVGFSAESCHILL